MHNLSCENEGGGGGRGAGGGANKKGLKRVFQTSYLSVLIKILFEFTHFFKHQSKFILLPAREGLVLGVGGGLLIRLIF